MIKTVGSVCSGIEAASVAWNFFDFQWFSEIEKFPSELLKEKYPIIPNLGDMRNIPEMLLNKQIVAPDLICGGTPCLTGDTLILTKDGYKQLIDVKVGDVVLSHDNQYHEVVRFMNQGIKSVFTIEVDGCEPIRATGNHRFYVLKKNTFGEPEWLSVDEIMTNGYENYYMGSFTAFHATRNGYFDNEYHWLHILSINDCSIPEPVYDIEVANSHSFVANNCITHNCQAFSLSGLRQGLNDDRGNLALKFVEIIETNDEIRETENKNNTIVFWENVEGVLSDKTNAFGCMISALAGLDDILTMKRWPNAGLLRGKTRNVAWRVLDAKYFGIPQQRKRLYLLAGGKDFYPENVLFELGEKPEVIYPETPLTFIKDNCSFEVFRTYTDCLYAAYGTKWNGNAAAYNGSLFVVQNQKLRRLSPLECERLMGFPDNYTNILRASKTSQYKALGNSWAIPVVKWIGKRLIEENQEKSILEINQEGFIDISKIPSINSSNMPLNPVIGSMFDVLSGNAPEDIYLSDKGRQGILRRAKERKVKLNERLEEYLRKD